MKNKTVRIWIWIEENKLHKAVYNSVEKTFIVYDESDNIILKRIGITPEQHIWIEEFFLSLGAKRIDGQKEPFTYL